MLHSIMHPDAVYQYPIWIVGLSMAAGAVGASLVLQLLVSRLLHVDLRRRHNVVTGAVISIIGVTYAVLLAFVAMLAWENYDAAKAATGQEAARLFGVVRASAYLNDPSRSDLRASLIAYAETVRNVEWPDQAEGRPSHAAEPALERADAVVATLRPADIGEGNRQAALMAALANLRDARDKRLAASETTIPGVIWLILILGGAITLASSSLLGSWHLRLQLTLAALLSLAGTLVLVMIVALSHPFRGDFRVTAEPFAASLTQMKPR